MPTPPRDSADRERFAPATRAWFEAAFPAGPTPAQEAAWEAIGRGENALVIAPTGSGKTLAAFLSAIDRLSRPSPPGGNRPKGVRVLYISPLKALGADVERNLRRPLTGITEAAERLGAEIVPIAVGVRSGDTPAQERRRLRTSPPDILITTPESLYLMLTSQVRETLRTVETVIVDEIHSFAGEKRGTHLAISLERLDDLLDAPAQRIGLSATVSPREEVARFLGGTHPVSIIADDGRSLPEITVAVPVDDMAHVPVTADRRTRMDRALAGPVRQGASRDLTSGTRTAGGPPRPGRGDAANAWRSDRALRRAMVGGGVAGVPGGSAGAVAGRAAAAAQSTASIWPHIEQALLDEVLAHRTTVVFVNSRGLCERLTAHLNEAYAMRVAEEGPADPDRLDDDADPASGAPSVPGSGTGSRADDVPPGLPPAAGGAPDDPWATGSSAPAPLAPEPALHRESWEMGDTKHALPLAAGAPVIARAHHGSVSKEQRLEVEHALKTGELRCVVATASLELGIDMGAIDLVLQVAPPPSVASGLQRVGRANHRVGGRPRGTIYPIQRTQLVDAAVVSEGMRAGRIEETVLVTNALDVLAQQTVAAAGVEELDADAWYATVRRAAPYRDLPRRAYDSVLELLAGGYASADLTDFAPRLTWDREAGTLAARPGAQRLAVGASGTIPDRGMFPVVLPEGSESAGRRRVGELDEEMVNETAVGDVITLGTSSWRVREISTDRVIVDPAPGRSSRLPFWHGEGPGRPAATGAAKGAFLREASLALPDAGDAAAEPPPPSALDARLTEDGLSERARRNLLALLREQRAATGVVPSDTTLVLERCKDEDGSWRLILHSPWGRRVHEPWAMAIRERVRLTLGIEPQLVVADDGIVLQVPLTETRVPGPELVVFDPDELTRLVRSRIGETALFAARFRECAARALLMPAAQPGRRTPLWLQRLKSGQLLEASRQFENFPIAVEAARECLQDVYDLPALAALMSRIAAGSVRVADVTTTTPSPFADPLVFGYTGALLYQGDLPHAERTAHLLSLDPDVIAELMGEEGGAGLLDDDVLAEVEAELQRLAPGRRARADAEGVADLLRELGPLSAEEVAARLAGGHASTDTDSGWASDASSEARAVASPETSSEGRSEASPAGTALASSPGTPQASSEGAPADGSPALRLLGALERDHRALRIRMAGREAWARTEDAPVLRGALGTQVPDWAVAPRAEGAVVRVATETRSPLGELVVRLLRTHAVLTPGKVAARLGTGTAVVEQTLTRLADEDAAMRLGGEAGERWMAPAVFRRIRNRSLARARAAVQPVPAHVLQRLVVERAGLAEARAGLDALADVLAQLEGVWLPSAAWEEVVLPARVTDYRPAMLDELLASGDVLWQARSSAAAADPVTDPGATAAPDEIAFFPSDSPLAPAASALSDSGSDPSATWALARSGGATASSFQPVRRSLNPRAAVPVRRVRSRRGRGRYGSLAMRLAPGPLAGLDADAGPGALSGTLSASADSRGAGTLVSAAPAWFSLSEPHATPEEAALALIESLLDRYGVLSRDVAVASGVPGGLGPLMPLLRRMEDTGALLRGRFVEGQGPMQLAERETVDLLRAMAGPEGAGQREAVNPSKAAAAPGAQGAGAAGRTAAASGAAASDAARSGAARSDAAGPGNVVVLDLKDPACLVGRGVSWPEPSLPPDLAARADETGGDGASPPPRRQGTSVVLLDGRPVLHATERLRALTSLTPNREELLRAVSALARRERRLAAREQRPARRTVTSLNGLPALDRGVSALLGQAGFVREPKGMRLPVDTYGRLTDPGSGAAV